MSTATAKQVTQVQYMRSYLRDLKPPYLWEDDELETYLWQTVQSHLRLSIYAYAHGAGLWLWQKGIRPGDPWRVTVTTPVAGQTYEINEPAGIVFNPEGGDTSDPLILECTLPHVRQAMYEALISASNNPARAAIYMQSNGYVVDARQAPGLMREQAQHLLGLH